jgi:hypothetical protein
MLKKTLVVAIAFLGFSGLVSADSLNVRTIGHYSVSNWGGRDLAISGNYAYVAADTGLIVLDISNPSNPTKISCNATLGYPYSIEVAGNYAYITDAASGLHVVNISDPANTFEASFFDTYGSAIDVKVVDTLVYLAPYYGLYILNASDHANPDSIGHINFSSNVKGIEVSGGYAYVAVRDSGMKVVSISDPTNPAIIGEFHASDEPYGIAVTGHCAYLVSNTGLQIVDVSDPANPAEIGHLDSLGSGYRVVVSGKFAYITSSGDGFHVVNISDPSKPFKAGYFNSFPMPWDAEGLTVNGGYIYVTYSDTGLGIYQGYGPAGMVADNESQAALNVENLKLKVFGNKISYQLPKNGFAGLKIYNLLGQEVRSLLNGNVTAGQHRINWDGSDAGNRRVASGVYLIRLNSGAQTATAKMLVVR